MIVFEFINKIRDTTKNINRSENHHHKTADDNSKFNHDDVPLEKSDYDKMRKKVIILGDFMINNITAKSYQNLKKTEVLHHPEQ